MCWSAQYIKSCIQNLTSLVKYQHEGCISMISWNWVKLHLTLLLPRATFVDRDSTHTYASLVPQATFGAHFRWPIIYSVCALCCSYLYSWKALVLSFTMMSGSRGVTIVNFQVIASRTLSKIPQSFRPILPPWTSHKLSNLLDFLLILIPRRILTSLVMFGTKILRNCQISRR